MSMNSALSYAECLLFIVVVVVVEVNDRVKSVASKRMQC